MSEALKKAKKKYKAKVKRFSIDFYPTETELYEHIQKQQKKQTYIKNLIRRDIQIETEQCQYCKNWRTSDCLYSADDPKANDCYGCFEK
jgi:hypothetical protein